MSTIRYNAISHVCFTHLMYSVLMSPVALHVAYERMFTVPLLLTLWESALIRCLSVIK